MTTENKKLGKEAFFEEFTDENKTFSDTFPTFKRYLGAKRVWQWIESYGDQRAQEERERIEREGDGFHTLSELYQHRHLLFANLVMNLTKLGYCTWKSKIHSDGSVIDGWFIAGINYTKGTQMSYHLPLEYWDLIHVRIEDFAPKFDGHTSEDVLSRLRLSVELIDNPLAKQQ